MEAVEALQNKVLKGVLIFDIVVGAAGYTLLNRGMPFLWGLVFGTMIAFLNFRLLYLTMKRAVQMSPGQAQTFAVSRYMMRYAITGIVLYLSLTREHIDVLGTIIGLISIKLVILRYELLKNKAFFKEIFKRKEGK